jgi:DNA invertase Pin-like site-specific DNA recombinase
LQRISADPARKEKVEMLKRTFNLYLPYRVVLYLRMSSDLQNKRSPEQQKKEIFRRIKAMKLPWKVVKVYIDDGKSGRLIRNRKSYQRMMRDLKSGMVQAEIIAVDMVERFGRVDELNDIRKELEQRYGILVLAGNTNFADPTTQEGRALGFVETMRATQDGEVKAHNVLRGKRDAVELGHWPGSKPPFGYKLKRHIGIVKGREEVTHTTLEPDSESDWLIEKLFQLAKDTAWGTARLACAFNDDASIPAKFKPFQGPSIGYWLDSEIYKGDLVWPKCNTGIVDDARVVKPADAEETRRYPNFCKPLVDESLWNEVQALREARRRRHHGGRKSQTGDERLIEPLAPGVVLTYLLTGLVCCGRCHRSMTPNSSRAYKAKDGTMRRYVSYVCPGFLGGHCPNSQRVPEQWLRQVVVDLVRQRFFN